MLNNLALLDLKFLQGMLVGYLILEMELILEFCLCCVFSNLISLKNTFFLQARPDLKMEFFHLLSFLLFHCNSKWKAASDQVIQYTLLMLINRH